MTFDNWKIQKINETLPEEVFILIEKNRKHISKTFPVTVLSCENFEKTKLYLIEAKENQEKEESYYFYLRNFETNNLIGFVMIKNINKKIRKCELAYFIDQDFEGKNIISKAVSKTIDYCFRELMMNKIFICTSEENFASQKIAVKNGFQQEGLLRQEFKNGEGNLVDILYFGLLKSEYDER